MENSFSFKGGTSTKIVSSAACVISMTRLLKHFNETNAHDFRQSLLQELDMTEGQLLCKIIRLLFQTMTTESLMTLKTQAIKLSEKQHSKNNKNISIYKQIQQKYKDPLSNLHSDIIDYFATFLDKKQSVELGYLNQQLYIETQKQSYLSKRCNDPPFTINDSIAKKFFLKETNPFAYSLPKHLNIAFSHKYHDYKIGRQQLQNSQWYQNIFSLLNSFTCSGYINMFPGTVGIAKFFGQNINRNKINGRLGQIETFSIEITGASWCFESIGKFCSDFNNYYTNYCGNKFDNIRSIKKLIFQNTEDSVVRIYGSGAELLTTLSKISNEIKFEKCKLVLDNVNDVKKIFHNNLKVFECDAHTSCEFDNTNMKNENIDYDLSDLEVSINLNPRYTYSSNAMEMLKKFGILSKISCLKVCVHRWECRKLALVPVFGDIFNIGTNVNVINDISRNTPDTVMIRILNESSKLYIFAEILEILTVNRFKILSLIVNNVKTVIFEVRMPNGSVIKAGKWVGDMWNQTSDTEYSIDENKIEVKNCDLTIKKLGIFYQNAIKWLKNIQIKYGNDQLKKSHFLQLQLGKQCW